MSDRLSTALSALFRSSMPRIDYYGRYEAKVIAQSGNNVDVQPTDARLPGMSKVALRHGLPGVSLSIPPGAYVLVGWDGGDPSKPFAEAWKGGESPIEITIKAATLNLGGTGGDALVKKAEFNAHTHKYNPGPSAPVESVSPSVPAVGTTKVKAV